MPKKTTDSDSNELLARFVGRWTGTAKTWFKPDAPPDKEAITSTIKLALGGPTLTQSYRTRAHGRAVRGQVLIARDISTGRFGLTWVDTAHTGDGMMTFRREDAVVKNGFSVYGEFAVGPDGPPWGWRITYQLKGPNSLEIWHYLIKPGGEVKPGVHILYKRG